MRTRLAYCLLACAVVACDDDAPANDTDTTSVADATTASDTSEAATDDAATTTVTTTADTTAAEDATAAPTDAAEDVSAEVADDVVEPVEPFVAYTMKVTEQVGDGAPVVTAEATCAADGAAYMDVTPEPTYGDLFATGCTLVTSQGIVKLQFRALGLAPGLGLTDSIPADRPPRLIASASKPGLWGAASGMTGFDARLAVTTYDDVAGTASGTLTIKQQPVVGATLQLLVIEGSWSGAW